MNSLSSLANSSPGAKNSQRCPESPMPKPYSAIPIEDCGEPLQPIPPEFYCLRPHPYASLGAPYGSASPFYLRQGVIQALQIAQIQLNTLYPGWRLGIFDGYRPLPVQQFMVDYTLKELAQSRGLSLGELLPPQREALEAEVYTFWALPSDNPLTPPPHSTGSAVDLTIVDAQDQPLDMGSAIDELSGRSHPDYYEPRQTDLALSLTDRAYASQVHDHRSLLYEVMQSAGFQRHPQEWWHFSRGDQLWAWLENQQGRPAIARYGSIKL